MNGLLLMLLFGAMGITLFALSDHTGYGKALITGGTSGLLGMVTDLQTNFSNLVLVPAMSGDYYAVFALIGVCFFAGVMLFNVVMTNVAYGRARLVQ